MTLVPAIPLDATMTASAVLARLARNGIWRDPGDPGAREWIAYHARRVKASVEEAAKRLERTGAIHVAIRRQLYANVLWYHRPAVDVVLACLKAPPDNTLREILDLHEGNSVPALSLPAGEDDPGAEGVVLHGDVPVAVSLGPRAIRQHVAPQDRMRGGGGEGWDLQVAFPRAGAAPRPPPPAAPRSGVRGPAPAPPPSAASVPAIEPAVQAWPRIDAPTYVPAKVEFPVTVGLTKEHHDHVSGGPIAIDAPKGAATVDVDVHLTADGLDAPGGWVQRLRLPVADPTSAEVTFKLVGRVPTGPEGIHLTTLEIRYVYGGTVRGTASRALVIGQPAAAAPPPKLEVGAAWADQPAAVSTLAFERDDLAPDLTIEIAKVDGNASSGRYVCRIYSPHEIEAASGPYPIDLGQDAKTFARASIVDELTRWDGRPLADNALRSIGGLVQDKLPPVAFDALREVAKKVAPEPPAVLVVSAEPYVPWELALVDPPLDPARPPYLGAQALVGRWIRERAADSSPPSAAGARPGACRKPPPCPPSRIPVQRMAVMAGLYKGAARLPSAEEEAKQLVETYGAVPLAATPQALKQLLDAKLEHDFVAVGGVEAMHFAGHGEFDPSKPDSSALFLDDGNPISSLLFRSARYGEERQPLVFLNACMIGVGGELLGDAGGFPGNCLKGGFGGVLGALWSVNDGVAAEIALEFWRRALPPKGAAEKPEPVGAVLRDLRSRYDDATPVSTWLAYVFYGHPRLTLAAA